MQREGQNREKLHILMVSICRKQAKRGKSCPLREVFSKETQPQGGLGAGDRWKIEPAQRGSMRFFGSEGNRSARIEEAFLG